MSCCFKSFKKNRLLLLAALLLSIGLSSFQGVPAPNITAAKKQLETAITLVRQEEYRTAVPLLREVLTVFERSSDGHEWITACKKLDWCYYNLRLADEGIAFFESASKTTGFHDTIRSKVLQLLADNYFLAGNYPAALENYEKGLPLAEVYQATEQLTGFYGNLGRIYWDLGNHAKALGFQKKSLQLAIALNDSTNIAYLLADIGDTYRSMDDPQALGFFQRSLSLDPLNAQALIQYSKAFQTFGMLDSALILIKSALPLLQNETEKADGYYQIAWVYLDFKASSQAIAHINMALKNALLGYGNTHDEYARFLAMAGRIYLAAGNPERALKYFDQVLAQQSAGHSPLGTQSQVNANELPSSSFWVLGSLEGKGKAYALKYEQTKDTQNLHAALAAFEMGMRYGERMRLSHSHESSKLELHQYIQPIVEGGVKTALDLAFISNNKQFVEQAYLFAERDKAPVMAEALYDKEIKHVAGIPDSLLAQERKLQETVTNLEITLYEAPKDEQLANELLNTQLEVEALKTFVKTAFPRYYALKYAFSKPNGLEKIRQNIPDSTLLVQYLVGQTEIYVFAISQTDLQSFCLPYNDSLRHVFETFRRAVSDWDFVKKSSIQAEQDFMASAPIMFDWLLSQPLGVAKAQHLIIVPDGLLGLVPFEAMLTKSYSGSWKGDQIPYVIRDYAVTYAWSASMLNRSKPPAAGYTHNFLGMGTQYDEANPSEELSMAMRTLGPLPNADDEVKAIGSLLNGKTWLNAEATKEHFLATAPQSGILHLATHGVLNEKNPMMSSLVFNKLDSNNNQLSALELYNVQLQAQLTVLSACNTGQGKVYNGEGIMSLARAFAFAGCPTLICSLWSVNDLSTATLMKGFYTLLKTGKPVADSMRAAKLQYLSSSSAEYAKPIYWAGFIVIGDNNTLPSSLFDREGISIWWGLAVAVLALLLYFLYKNRKTALR